MKRFILQTRDLDILKAVNRFRYLQTRQIKKLLFDSNTTPQSTRRRLRCLIDGEYLGRFSPAIGFDNPKPDAVYYLKRAGASTLELQNEEVFFYPKAFAIKPMFLNHALDISEFRINLELALKEHAAVELRAFIPDYELKSNFHSFKGRWRYRLYNQVIHKEKQRAYAVYPDAAIILQGRNKYKEHRRLFFLEIDRGTAGLRIIQDKVIGYSLFREQRFFEKTFPGFTEFIVLLQTNSQQRAINIRERISREEGNELIWIAHSEVINQETVVLKNVWMDDQQDLRSLIKS